MSESKTVRLMDAQSGHRMLLDLWAWCKPMLLAGQELTMTVKKSSRSIEQNRLMWSCLTDLSNQCEWMVDGRPAKLDAEDVKHILTAALKKHQRMARGIDGGLVILGQSTSKMTVQEMSELITLAHAHGDSNGVIWSKTSLGRDGQFMDEK